MAQMNQAMTDLLRYNAAILPRTRSVYDKSHSHLTTLDSAFLVPLMYDRVIPGDEKKIRYSGLARMATPIAPTMDTANLDVWAFFVPDRLTWVYAKEFYGENKDASFNPDGQYRMPHLSFHQAALFDLSSEKLKDYFGMPYWNNEMAAYSASQYLPNVSATLFRGYHLIWNEWFRNSSVQPAARLNDGNDVTSDELSYLFKLRKVCKYPDYFTTLLKEPQAGADVLLPLGDWAPVVTRADKTSITSYPLTFQGIGFTPNKQPLVVNGLDGSVAVGGTAESSVSGSGIVQPSNLWADLTNATAATINNIRAAVTIQHLLEIDAMAGKRYQQILQAHFGVFTPDATLQRPELLGATRTPIGMRQVLQTSASTAESPQGNVAAFSLTNITNEWICNKSFTEPGWLYVLGAIRPVMSYSQGLDPLVTKIDRYDHYWPVFANIGNQPVYKYNIMCSWNEDLNGQYDDGYSTQFADVFGYQEAWTEYRIKNNRVSGLMRPDVPGSLSVWNYSQNFTSIPILNNDFVEQDENLIERTIAVKDEPQFILDSYFDYTDISCVPVHSIPGVERL